MAGSEMPFWLEDLNEAQRRAVTHRPAPLLVVAGPGSGKTRIITRRIAWLVHEKQAQPENMLAVTFTNRAAEEMRERLFGFLGDEAERVWVHTFHAAALRILRKFGERVGLAPEFRVVDEDEQRRILARELQRLRVSREQFSVGDLASRISLSKSRLEHPEVALGQEDPTVAEVVRGYEAWLREHGALDFDDLIRYAVHLLRSDAEVRAFYHRTLEHILVDEYQDINQAQYAFLSLLAPPGASITAVADEDQTIYGWRGSDPAFVDAFIRRYNPTIVKLPYSYRCPPSILYGAQHLIAREPKPENRRNFMQSRAEGGDTPIYHYMFYHISQEQQWLVTLIRKLMAERGMEPGDIAILYRTHRLARPAEQALLQAGFKVQRVRPKGFFERSQVREVVRFLHMARALMEVDVPGLLNFPAHQVDEITMVQLRRLAREQGVDLTDLVRRPDDFPQLSPLTRYHLRRLARWAEEAGPQLDMDAEEAVQGAFEALEGWRSPWRQRDREGLARWLHGWRCDAQVAALRKALEAGQSVAAVYDEGLDTYLAAVLFRRALADYLGLEVRMVKMGGYQPEEGEVAVWFGRAEDAPAGVLVPPELPQVPPVVWAWRCAQQLVLGYERLAEGRFVFYDVETTGPHVRRDEIVELAAWAYEHGEPAGEPFQTLVRPQRGRIPPAATRVHGIRNEDVADAPGIEEVLPAFLAYLGEDVVVGHNIARFDNRFVDRACAQVLEGQGFYPLYVDTLRLARRLLPDLDHYSLEYLSEALGLHHGKIQHRALEDLQVTATLFYLLVDYLMQEKEQESLTGYLPLVGLGLLLDEEGGGEYRAMLLDAAARVARSQEGRALLQEVMAALPPSFQASFTPLVDALAAREPREDEEDAAWRSLMQGFMQHVTAFKRYSTDTSLRAFLDYQALLNNVDTFAHEAEQDAITMMTLHNAKGTEFPVVIILGVEQENLPIWRSLQDPRKLAEERRVLYVGITRAKRAVYLFSTQRREDGFVRSPSQFAFEIPRRYIRHFRVHADGRVEEV